MLPVWPEVASLGGVMEGRSPLGWGHLGRATEEGGILQGSEGRWCLHAEGVVVGCHGRRQSSRMQHAGKSDWA